LCPRPARGLGLIRNSPAGIDARLPAPSGPFIVVKRIYWPKPGAHDGNWQKPPLEKAN
jgi:hypothetical protein